MKEEGKNRRAPASERERAATYSDGRSRRLPIAAIITGNGKNVRGNVGLNEPLSNLLCSQTLHASCRSLLVGILGRRRHFLYVCGDPSKVMLFREVLVVGRVVGFEAKTLLAGIVRFNFLVAWYCSLCLQSRPHVDQVRELLIRDDGRATGTAGPEAPWAPCSRRFLPFMPTQGASAHAVGGGQALDSATDRLCRITVSRVIYPMRHSQCPSCTRVAKRCFLAT